MTSTHCFIIPKLFDVFHGIMCILLLLLLLLILLDFWI